MVYGQIVTAGNGISLMGNDLVSAATINGLFSQFDHTLLIETKHMIVETTTAIIHHALHSIQFHLFRVINGSFIIVAVKYLPFYPMSFLNNKMFNTMNGAS